MIHMKIGTQLRIFYGVVLFILVLQGFSIYNTNRQAHLACRRVQNLQDYAISTLDRSEKTLPTLAYYKEHPAELQRQLKFTAEYKSGFPPVACSNNALIP